MLIGSIIVFALLLYVMLPKIYLWFVHYGAGVSGLAFYFVISLAVTAAFFLMGYRGKSLLYIFVLALGIVLMFWLYQNYRDLDSYIGSRFGQLAATGVFLLMGPPAGGKHVIER